MSVFSQLVPYLKDPLIIIGLVLFLLLFLLRYLLHQQVIKQLPSQLDGPLPRWLLSHAFWLGLLLMLLGVHLKHSNLRAAEQQQARQLLGSEFKQNMATLNVFENKTRQAIQLHEQVSSALRSGDSQILKLIFPVANTLPNTELDITASVEASFQKLKVSGWLKNPASMAQFNQDKTDIKLEVELLTSGLLALVLDENEHYVIAKEVWTHHAEVYRDMDDFDLALYEDGLIQMEELRDSHVSVLNQSAEFFSVVNDFMARSTFLGNRDVYEILSQERHSYQLLIIYADELKQQQRALLAVAQQLQLNQ